MAESVPPPPELREQLEGEEPQTVSRAEKIADWVQRRLQRGSPDKAPGFLLRDAVAQGMSTAIGRVAGYFCFCALCAVLAHAWMEAGRVGDRLFQIPYDEVPGIIKTMALIGIVIPAVIGFGVIFSDCEQKVRSLHWIFFAVVACATLVISHQALVPVSMLIGQFYVHWIIHSGIQLRERRREWEKQRERLEVLKQSFRIPPGGADVPNRQ